MNQKTAKKTAQQGDVILRRLTSFPDGDRQVIAKKRLVIAEGEASGHAHVIEDDESEMIRIGERMLLYLEKEAIIKHEEHGPITLSPGIWEIGRVREYDWFQHMERQVVD